MTQVTWQAAGQLLLPFSVVLPLILAIGAFLGLARLNRLMLFGLSLLILSTGVLAAIVMIHGPVVIALGGWALPVGIQWHLDVPGALMLTMTALVAGLSSLALMGEPQARTDQHLWPLWWLLWAGLNALLLSRDLFNLYVTLELVAVAAVGLVAQSSADPRGRAALRYLLVSLLASMLYLLGVALIYGQIGSLDLVQVGERLADDATTRLAALLITLGLMVKAALVPFHIWLPMAHSRAQPPVSAMLSAVVVAAPLFLMWRLWLGPFAVLEGQLRSGFALLGTLGILWGSLQAFFQTRVKRLVAYSTLSQLGMGLLLLGLIDVPNWSGQAGQGALTLLLAHGLAKASLFLAAGAIVRHHGHDRLAGLAGSASQLPVVWLAIALAATSLIGVPPTGGFAGKWGLLSATFAGGQWTLAGVLLVGTLLTAAYLWRLVGRGLMSSNTSGMPPETHVRRLSALALCAALLAWMTGFAAFVPAGLDTMLRLPGWDTLTLIFGLPALLIWPVAIGFALTWRRLEPAPGRLVALLIACMACHLMVLTARDLLTFYLAMSLMSLCGWALVAHDGSSNARSAGVSYLGMMLLAELCLLAAMVMIARQANTFAFDALAEIPFSGATLALLALGLGLKAGMPLLHQWLPVAHPVAPAVASAVLSGLIIKAGVLGALRLLPEQGLTVTWGLPLMLLGVAMAFYAVARGLVQREPKALLAWSSVSQMGLIAALLGALLAGETKAWSALLLLVMVHGLAKAALFLGAGMAPRTAMVRRPWILAGMLLPALALAGVAPTGGVWIKYLASGSLSGLGLPGWLLSLSAIATSLLLLRFFLLCHRLPESDLGANLRVPTWLDMAWWGLGVTACLLPWVWHLVSPLGDLTLSRLAVWMLDGLWPLLAALAITWGAWGLRHFLQNLLSQVEAVRNRRTLAVARQHRKYRRLRWRLKQLETQLQQWQNVGLSLGLVALAIAVLLWLPGG